MRALLVLLLSTAACAAVESSPGFADARPLLERSLTSAARGDLAAHADLPLCRIRARWDEQRRLLIGSLRIDWRNASTKPVRDLGLHTFPDCACYQASSLALADIVVDGRPAAEPRMVADGAGAVVDLAQPIAPGAWAAIEMSYAIAPSRSNGYHGLDADHGQSVCLYGWYPELAARVNDAWDTHPLGGLCDPTASVMTHVVAELDVPADAAVAVGGSTVNERTADGRRMLTVAGAFTRDLALVIADKLERTERTVGQTTVVSWCAPGDTAGGDVALDVAAQSLELYGERFGAYPYAELDAVEVPLGDDVGGMESSGLVLIDRSCYRTLRRAGPNPPPMALFMMTVCVSHEVGHQWWYGLVGSDAWTSAWLDESLTNWTGCWYLDERGGALASSGWSLSLAECMTRSATTMAATLDAGAYAEQDYGAVIYGRGALMYQALRHQLGDQAFFAFLRAWFADHRYGTVDGAQWRAALAKALGEEAAATFARKWLDAQGLTRRDLAEAGRQQSPEPPPAQTQPLSQPVAAPAPGNDAGATTVPP